MRTSISMNVSFLIAVCTLACYASCRTSAPTAADTQTDCCTGKIAYDVPELTKPPQFPGGDAAMVAWLGNRLARPAEARDVKESPLIQFHVACDGTLAAIAVKVAAHPALDSLALKAVRDMPRWAPGKIKDKVVCTFYVLPVNFE